MIWIGVNKARFRAFLFFIKKVVEFEDILLALAVGAFIVGLGMIYLPLALIVPGAGFVGWAAWRRR